MTMIQGHAATEAHESLRQPEAVDAHKVVPMTMSRGSAHETAGARNQPTSTASQVQGH
jgi:hypothetical protein